MVVGRQWVLWPALVLAVMLGGGWAVACPRVCSCRLQYDLLSANCSSLPYNGGKVEALTLLPSRDTPVELSDGKFNQAKHLKYLSLRNSSVFFVHKKAFYGAKKLLEIDLSFNYIEELDPTVLLHLNNLTKFLLRGNPIHLVPEVPFLISNSLQRLDIGECKIKSIPRGIFYELKRLKYLSLDGNFLKSIAYNSLPAGLTYLDISNNLIVNVPTEVISALTNLRRLGLAGNPINCSCSLMDLQDWLSGRGVMFKDNVICTSPSKYKGVSWSKVDENKLCVVEARREEMMENKLYKQPSNHKIFYSEENFQSDQPAVVPDSQVDVLMENDATLAMGEMMRDEENREEEMTSSPTSDAAQNINSEPADLNSPDRVSNKKTETENILRDETSLRSVESNANTSDSSSKPSSSTNVAENVDIEANQPQSITLNESSPVEYKTLNDEESEDDEFKKEGLVHVDNDKSRADPNITMEESTVIPDIEVATEEEWSGDGARPEDEEDSTGDMSANQNLTSTTEINNGTIVVTPVKSDEAEEEEEETVPPPVIVPNLLAPSESQQNATESEHKTESPIISPEAPERNKEVPHVEAEPPSDTHVTTGNGLLPPSAPATESPIDTHGTPKNEEPSEGHIVEKTKEPNKQEAESKEEKIKEMAGAEVVMFCAAVLVICLVLYSIYKCRSSKNRQSVSNIKDIESNRGTELQDMASLLPKPEEEKKNNLKYEDKPPSSETVKLLTEKNENETPNFKPVAEAKTKIEDKNSLNNNTPTSKTPLIKPEKPVAISTAAPIQRTKVRVGIIPDSIPRTPIFLQKTYTGNGTKNV